MRRLLPRIARSLRLVPLLLSLAAFSVATAQTPPPPLPAVSVPIDVAGKDGAAVPDLKPSDLEVRLGGSLVSGASLVPLGHERRIVIFVDRSLAGSRTMRGAVGALAALAKELTDLGPVEVVVAEPEPRSFFAPSRDAKKLDNALSRLWLQSEGRDDLRELRRRFLEERKAAQGDEAGDGGEEGDAAAVAQDAEVRLVRGRLDALTEWLLARRADESGGPGLLFLVSDGFDVDPSAFYGGVKRGDLDAYAAHSAQSLSALGWTVYPLPMGDVTLPDLSRIRPGGSRTAPIGGTITLGSRNKSAAPKTPPPPVLKNPLEPLGWMAEASGGQSVTDPHVLALLLTRLKSSPLLAFTPPTPVEPGHPAALAVTANRSGLVVHAPRWQGGGLPAAITAARATRLVDFEEEGGGLEVLVAAQTEEGGAGTRKVALEVKVQARSAELGAAAPGAEPGALASLFATIASPGGESVVFRQPLRGGEAREGGEVAYLLRFEVPAALERLAVVVETPSGAPWGGALVALEQKPSAPAGVESGVVLRLKTPLGDELTGRTRIEVEGQGPGVARVEVFLAGHQAGGCAALPCSLEIELARRPVVQIVRAVAFDAEGRELARDELTLNDPDSFRVRLVEPAGRRGVGAVEAEAEVRAPAGAQVERVEFYWEDILAGTVYAPPFRHRITVSAAHPLGTLRAEARLADGTTAEDSIVLNAPGVSERIDVRLVEVNVVVDDEHGKSVRGLPREAFRLTESGREQALASFENTGDLPLTLALAIDSSASMFRKLPVVGAAVESLLAEGLTPRDRALLVQFDDAPHLLQPATRDLGLLTTALRSLHADGGTGLWDAVAFSLSQLRGIRGRKSLIVYSDGIDEGGKVAYSEALRAVRESGVPVFLIVSNALAAAGQDGGFLSESIGSRLKRLTDGVGGRVVFLGPDQNLPEVYQQILADLRSRYTLSFYPAEATRGERRPGPIEVSLIGRKGLKARVVSGGLPRR